MFLPFIPYIVILAGCTALLAMPSLAGVAPALGAGELLGMYLLLLALGGIMGHLPDRWLGRLGHGSTDQAPHNREGALRRRVLFMGVWLAALGISDVPHLLAGAFEKLPWGGVPAEEAALGALLLNFWLGEALALSPFAPWHRATLRAQLQGLGWRLRLPAPILVVILGGLTAPALADGILLPGLNGLGGMDTQGGLDGLGAWWSLAGPLLMILLVAGMAVPVLMRWCWGLRPLHLHPLGGAALSETVWGELRASKVRVAQVLAWPDELMGFATAGVVGVLPPFRYLLFSPTLGLNLTPEEVRAVTAHEAGHLRHGHLWFLLMALLGFVLISQAAVMALIWAGLLTGSLPPLWAMIVAEVGALLIFLRYGLGFLSRNFERQADAQAVRRAGVEPLAASLQKLAGINGIAPAKDNWHHYGIVQRIDYARAASQDTARLDSHDRRVRSIQVGIALFCALALGVQVLMASGVVIDRVGESILRERMAGLESPLPQHLTGLRFLASQAYARNDLYDAERWFRLILQVLPDDPQAQNNLAWVLVTRPDGSAPEHEEGLRLAKAAVNAADEAYVWDTLAEAYGALGRGGEALASARKALHLAEAGQGRGSASLDYYRERVRLFGG